MRCVICHKEFIPSKYRPNQTVCSKLECQRKRQVENQRTWRLKNPDYFKCLGQETSWRMIRQRYSKMWREAHKEEIKAYEKSYKEQRRQYMRGYMREYRKGLSVNRGKS